jgi:cobalamin biosynthesis protein CobW
MVSSNYGNLEADLLLGFNAAVEEHLSERPSHHDSEEDHDHDDEITSTQFVVPHAYDPERLLHRLKILVELEEIYRIKGFVSVPNKPMRLVIQGVGKRFDQFYDRPWAADEPRETRLVFIGRALDSERIQSHLARLPV